MNRWRIASLIVFAWCLLQLWGIARLGREFWAHPTGWLLVPLGLALAAGLWLRFTWARIATLVIGSAFLGLYAWTLYPGGLPCGSLRSLCALDVLFPPAAALAAVLVLLRVRPLTTAWSGS